MPADLAFYAGALLIFGQPDGNGIFAGRVLLPLFTGFPIHTGQVDTHVEGTSSHRHVAAFGTGRGRAGGLG